MGNAGLMMDGNALAGVLGEIFVREMTSARLACEGCGNVEPIGAQHAYIQAPGIVLRCCHCEGALLVLTRARGKHLVGFGQTMWLELSDHTGMP